MNSSSSFTTPTTSKTIKCFFLPEPQFDRVSQDRHITNLITVLFNFALVPFALSSNFILVFVVTRTATLQSPSNILLSCLALSDFLVGFIVQPLYSGFRLMEMSNLYVPCAYRVVYSESFWVCYGVSFITLSALSCERYVALRLHLRYNELVTTKGVLQSIVAIWVFDIVLTSLQWIDHGSVVRNMQIAIFLLCVLVTLFVQIKIIGIIRRHQRQIDELSASNFDSNRAQHSLSFQTKLAKNIMYIAGFYVLFNMPVLIVQMYQFAGGTFTSLNVFSWAETIAFTKSSVNPVICGWKNKEIRQEIMKRLRKCWRMDSVERHGSGD